MSDGKRDKIFEKINEDLLVIEEELSDEEYWQWHEFYDDMHETQTAWVGGGVASRYGINFRNNDEIDVESLWSVQPEI